MLKSWRYKSVYIGLLAALLGGCGDNNDHKPTPATLTGVFDDGPVQSLRYATATQSGMTNDKGEFSYREGERVEFFLNNASIGSTAAKAVVTPVDVAGSNLPYTDNRVVNRIRLLLSLDTKPNEPGIALDASRTFDTLAFDVAPEKFSVSGVTLVTRTQALSHFENTLRRLGRHNSTVSTSPVVFNETKVIATPDTLKDVRTVFSKYLSVTAPNGKPIHILAQEGVKDASILRARQIMAFYLGDAAVNGSSVTIDKSAVANAMANNNAALTLFTSQAESEKALKQLCQLVTTNNCDEMGEETKLPYDLKIQDLYDDEILVEGSSEYLNSIASQNSGKRDASFEEILHLVQNAGIEFSDKVFAQQIQTAANKAAYGTGSACSDRNGKLWLVGGDHDDTCEEWEEESIGDFNSLASEFYATVTEVYFGLWAHTDHSGVTNPGEAFFGEYRLNNRKELGDKNADALPIIKKFSPPELRYEAKLDQAFTGTFQLSFDASVPYTHKSQYLRNVTLTGSNSANISGNGGDNIFMGNSGDNVLDGHAGTDTVVLAGGFGDYNLVFNDDSVTVTGNGGGTDTLKNIEILRFTDRMCQVSQLKAESSGSRCSGFIQSR